MIIVEVRDRIGQYANAAVSGVCNLLRLSSTLSSRLRLLLDFSSFGVNGLDTGLGAGVNVLDVSAVLRRKVVELIGLVDQWRRLRFDIVLAGAADGGHHTRCQANHERSAVHRVRLLEIPFSIGRAPGFPARRIANFVLGKLKLVYKSHSYFCTGRASSLDAGSQQQVYMLSIRCMTFHGKAIAFPDAPERKPHIQNGKFIRFS